MQGARLNQTTLQTYKAYDYSGFGNVFNYLRHDDYRAHLKPLNYFFSEHFIANFTSCVNMYCADSLL